MMLNLFISNEYRLSIYDPQVNLRDPNNLLISHYVNSGEQVLVILSVGENTPLPSIEKYSYIIDFTQLNGIQVDGFDKYFFEYDSQNNGRIGAIKEMAQKRLKNGWYSFLKLGYLSKYKNGASKLTVYSKNGLSYMRELKPLNYDTYTINLDSNTFYKQAIIHLLKNGLLKYTVQIAFSPQARSVMMKEIKLLSRYNELFETVRMPKVLASRNSRVTTLSYDYGNTISEGNRFSILHGKALAELMEKTLVKKEIYDTDIFNKVKDNFNYIAQFKEFPRVRRILHLLKELRSQISLREELLFSFAHFNFTPVNLQIEKDTLYLSDWRLCQEEIPVFYDFFHFHFKRAIRDKSSNYSKIHSSIRKALKNPEIAKIIEGYDIDYMKYYRAYLIISISYNLALYLVQDDLTSENDYELIIWEKALMDLTPVVSRRSYREEFIEEFYLKLKKTPHAILRFSEDRLQCPKFLSDLDIFLLEDDLSAMYTFLKAHPMLAKYRIFRQSDMWKVDLFFKDGSFICMNLIYRFKCRSLEFLDGKRLLISRNINQYAPIRAQNKYDLEYAYLYYTLNNISIPKEFHQYFLKEENMNFLDQKKAYDYLKGKYQLDIVKYEDLFHFSNGARNNILKEVKKQSQNNGLNRFTNVLNFVVDEIRGVFRRKGLSITIGGVDERGKDLVLYGLKTMIESKYHKEVVVLKNRPGLFRDRVKALSNKRNGLVISIYKVGFQCFDYLIGQFMIQYKYIAKGKVVIYDQYYFDFIQDDTKHQLIEEAHFLRRLYYFIRKPNLNYFLCGSISRKYSPRANISREKVVTKVKSYKKLFADLKRQYPRNNFTLIQGLDLTQTLAKIEREYLSKV